MTDDQAARKWCPMVVASHTNPRLMVTTRKLPGHAPTDEFVHNCIGSKCALWVTHRPPYSPGAKVEPAAPSGQCGLINHPAR